jgi:hypothetical protein
MTGMTDTITAWAPTDHPRESSGRFSVKATSAPEVAITAVPAHPRATAPERPALPSQPLVTGVPWHLRDIDDLTPRSPEDNPILEAFREARIEHGDTAEQWAAQIESTFHDGDDDACTPDIRTDLADAIGAPRDETDVEHWRARTDAWAQHALTHLRD